MQEKWTDKEGKAQSRVRILVERARKILSPVKEEQAVEVEAVEELGEEAFPQVEENGDEINF